MALEAALFGVPVGVFGNVHFQYAPGITALSSPNDWLKLIGTSKATEPEIIDWYGKFIDKYAVEGSFWGEVLTKNIPSIIENIIQKD